MRKTSDTPLFLSYNGLNEPTYNQYTLNMVFPTMNHTSTFTEVES